MKKVRKSFLYLPVLVRQWELAILKIPLFN